MSEAPDTGALQDSAQDSTPGPAQDSTQGPPQNSTQDPSQDASKPTEDWVTGDEPMTGPQRSYLHTLAREAGRELPEQLTKAQASELIEELQAATGRGRS
jgi:hypothetical protein